MNCRRRAATRAGTNLKVWPPNVRDLEHLAALLER